MPKICTYNVKKCPKKTFGAHTNPNKTLITFKKILDFCPPLGSKILGQKLLSFGSIFLDFRSKTSFTSRLFGQSFFGRIQSSNTTVDYLKKSFNKKRVLGPKLKDKMRFEAKNHRILALLLR